jgi:CO/xanthine dehydrogenase Mo-binding subunit
MTEVLKDPARTPEERAFRYVNRSVPRRDGVEKVTGRALYASDVTLPGIVHAKVVRSDVAHARLLGVDAEDALRRPGVLAVLTGEDIAGLPSPRYGHIFRDHPVLAIDRIRYAGEPVAAVIARTEAQAAAAVPDVRVSYEPLPSAMSVLEAIAEDSSVLHEDRPDVGTFSGIEYGHGEDTPYRNICHHNHVEWGDVDAAAPHCARIYEHTYEFPLAYAYAMEPYVAVADYRSTGLTVTSSSQHPYMVRHDLSAVFGLPLSGVSVQVPYIGGGYGSKSYTKLEPLAAACSRKVGRPVRLAYSVEEAILTTRVAGARMRFRTGVDAEGRILLRDVEMLFDGGAYAENGPLGAQQAAERVVGPCAIPNVRVDSYLVYTNTAPSSSFRGFTTTQPTFASESQLDEIALDMGIDPLELRLRNTVAKGEEFIPGARPLDGDVREDVRMVAEALDWSSRTSGRGRGSGLATMMLTGGAKPVSLAQVRLHGDGSVTISTGTTELGQGSETVLCQIAAEELCVPLEAVSVAPRSTSLAPFDRSTGASRSTTLQGRALIAACADIRRKLRDLLVQVADVEARAVADTDEGFLTPQGFWSFGDVLRAFYGVPEADVVGEGHVRQAGDLALTPVFWETSSVGVEVTVDEETGRISWDRMVVVGDVGLAINPAMAAGQDLGGAVQGAGVAFWEELRYEGEHLATPSLASYRIPRFSDLPRDVELLVAERRDGTGPYGAKGGGEGPVSAIAPAVANALAAATGVRLRLLPLTPERVWRALRETER